MLFEAVFFVLGLVLLVFSSDRVVHSAGQLASHLGISEFIVGLLVVAFGTSLPELVTSVIASSDGHTVIALGNVVGSNIANIGLILGLAGMTGSLAIRRNRLHIIQASILLGVTALACILLAAGGIGRNAGFFLLGCFGLYLYVLWQKAAVQVEHHEAALATAGKSQSDAILHLSVVIMSAFGLWLSARWIVEGVLAFSDFFGIGQGIVALTAVAIGTSLPELSVALQAMRNNHAELLLGDILGANTINIMLVLGVSGIINPILPTPNMLLMLPVLAGFTLMFWILIKIGRHITRTEGAILLLSYLLTMVFLGWFV